MRALILNGSPVKNGATAQITKIIEKYIAKKYDAKTICIDDYEIKYCRGCKSCYSTAKCVQSDGFTDLISEMEKADIIIIVAPSYWSDIPGQLKSFIDRCTPYCNTHEPHASIGPSKKGYVVALRTGIDPVECFRIIENIKHFYGHMEIDTFGEFYLCKIKTKEDVDMYMDSICNFCETI